MIELELARLGEYAVVSAITGFFILFGMQINWLYHAHRNPDEYGFGSMQMLKSQKKNSANIRSLLRLVMWLAEKEYGDLPPTLMVVVHEEDDEEKDK